MKIILISVLLAFSSFNSAINECDELKFDFKIVNTSNGLDNGAIEVKITKSSSKVKAYLYSYGKSDNRLGVKTDELDNLRKGKYMLVLQNDNCFAAERDIIIK